MLLLLTYLSTQNIGTYYQCNSFLIRFGGLSSLICYYLCLFIFSLGSVSSVMETKVSGFFFDLFTIKNSIIVVLTPLIALIPDFLYLYTRKLLYPDNTEIIKKIEREGIKQPIKEVL